MVLVLRMLVHFTESNRICGMHACAFYGCMCVFTISLVCDGQHVLTIMSESHPSNLTGFPVRILNKVTYTSALNLLFVTVYGSVHQLNINIIFK